MSNETIESLLADFPGGKTLIAWVLAFREETKKLRYGAASRWIKRQNVSSRQRAERHGTDIVTVNRIRRDGHVDAHTTVPLDAAPPLVLAALNEVPWSTWWRHSDTEVLERDSAQRIRRFVIHPLGKRRVPKLWVEIALEQPRPPRPEDPRIVVAADFSGSFNGRGSLEIEDLGSDSCTLGIHWPNFDVTGDLSWLPALAIVLHGNTPGRRAFRPLG